MKMLVAVCVPPRDGEPSLDAVKEHMDKLKAHLEAGGFELVALDFRGWNPERMFYDSLRAELEIQKFQERQPWRMPGYTEPDYQQIMKEVAAKKRLEQSIKEFERLRTGLPELEDV
jgi:hypothetical protein